MLTCFACCADPTFKENLVTTVEDLLGMNVVPVFNENDAISKGVVKSTVCLLPTQPRATGTQNPCQYLGSA